jgi:hypothetical protein
MRDVLDRLEALGRYGEPRQTGDLDIVVDLDVRGFERIVPHFEDAYAVADAVDFGGHIMASLISVADFGKVDVILKGGGPWSESVMDRRHRWTHPVLGPVWIISLEDLVIAKLAWSSGTSELQLRDCRNLVRVNEDAIDWAYLDHWARAKGVEGLLRQVRDAP